MKKQVIRKLLISALSVSVLASNVYPVSAAVPKDGMTDASQTAEAGAEGYEKWQKEWETIQKDWTQISLTPGSDETQLNAAWYSLASDSTAPKFKIGKGKKMDGAKEYTATQTAATKDDKKDIAYLSNKVTVTGLEANTTYYYSYQINGKWSAVQKYKTHSPKSFSFIYVGDPQIGSSNSLKGADTEEFYSAQSAAVANDTFNWNTTLEQAMEKTNNQASFVLSAGDQIQTTKTKSPGKAAWVSEIEYAGYLSPDVLKSLAVATTVGNHDADNPNYTYHFNTPNNSEKGSNGIVGGDYWFTYGNALFMMLNTQETNTAEHKQFIEEAIARNKDCKWRIVTLHQDIYGSAEHSNEPEITNLRYTLVPYFEENDIDVVLTGHDHAYSRSQILKGGRKTTTYSDGDADEVDDKYSEQFDKDVETETSAPVFVSQGNILDNTSDSAERQYLDYLNAVMDQLAVVAATKNKNTVVNPDGILYMTANSSSGSKYYDLVARKQSYIANRWQEDVPTYSVIDMTENTFTINTYRTDTDEKIDDTFTIRKETAEAPIKEPQKTTGTDNKNTNTGNGNSAKNTASSVKPPKVKLKKVSAAGAKKVKVTFAKSKTAVTGYQITYSLKKNFKKAKKVTTKKTTYTLKKLKKGKRYYIKVRAYKTVKGKKIYGAYSAVKKIKIRK